MSKSLEALENVKTAPSFMGGNPRYWTCLQSSIPFLEDINTIKQDLERKEELEKENQELKDYIKALDKACEILDWDCPVSQDLVDDLDCENCNDNYKECWKKYFLKEVLENEK